MTLSIDVTFIHEEKNKFTAQSKWINTKYSMLSRDHVLNMSQWLVHAWRCHGDCSNNAVNDSAIHVYNIANNHVFYSFTAAFQ